MTSYHGQGGSGYDDAPPVGSKRAMLKGYLRAAKETAQSYHAQYASSGWGQRGGGLDDYQDGIPGGYPDAAVVTSGDEQMILFPSYARKHIKSKEEPKPPRPTLEGDTTQGEFLKPQWDEYREDNAVVDVDVRGWVFSPHKGQMTRRQRVFVSLARQLAGLPAPTQPSPSGSAISSRDTSPHTAHRQRTEERQHRYENEEAARQAEALVRRGESEAAAASRGDYTEGSQHSPLEWTGSSRPNSLHRLATSNAADGTKPGSVDRRATWNQPADMSAEELASANAHLMARLAPFMSNPLGDTPISAFFYNEKVSRQRTIYTSSYGHFALRASLDFVPTHVRILASDKLSATEEVVVTPSKGITLISDIDDTIKHSAISSGAREIFRNAFIRDLADLNIEGVQEWYSRLADMGVKFHYVSNSPWQLYPVLQKYFQMSGLPPGSFHLKQYSGMLQGIFEPVAERKKGTLDRIANDFPERRFILVGDSGEADLEVYLDFVSENPGRVLAILIRDVTTPRTNGFFDSSMGSMTGQRASHARRQGVNGTNAQAHDDEDDPGLKAAIAASLKTLEEEEMRNRPNLPSRAPSAAAVLGKPSSATDTEDLIDLSDDPQPPALGQRSISNFTVPPTARKPSTGINGTSKAPPPSVPRKPLTLQSKTSIPSASLPSEDGFSKKVPPPAPIRRSTGSSIASSMTTQQPPTTNISTKPPLLRQNSPSPSIASTSTNYSYRESARNKLSNVYNALPAAPWNSNYVHTELNRNSLLPPNDNVQRQPGPGRALSSYPAAAGRTLTNAWTTYNDPGRASQPEQSVAARPYSTNAGGGDPARNGTATALPVDKKLELWAQRWARAQEYCRERGIVLRSWRVGSDVMDESVRIVEKGLREDEQERG